MPEVSRDTIAASLAPYGPLVGLDMGMGDVATTRQILRKCGISSIVVTPERPGAWRFEGRLTSVGLFTDGHLPLPSLPPRTLFVDARAGRPLIERVAR
jgi:hypothetical protein